MMPTSWVLPFWSFWLGVHTCTLMEFPSAFRALVVVAHVVILNELRKKFADAD